MKKNYPLYLCIFILILLNIFILFSNIQSKNNQENYFRMHVVANSNSIDDQIIKLNVTKKINNYLNTLYKTMYINETNSNQKECAKTIIENNINTILEVANYELAHQSANYNCCAKIGKISYEEKSSDKINMDKGIYDSIQIVLGDGKGENFWSLIFPYSYNPNFNITDNKQDIFSDEIEIKSEILETLKKVVKTFKS